MTDGLPNEDVITIATIILSFTIGSYLGGLSVKEAIVCMIAFFGLMTVAAALSIFIVYYVFPKILKVKEVLFK